MRTITSALKAAKTTWLDVFGAALDLEEPAEEISSGTSPRIIAALILASSNAGSEGGGALLRGYVRQGHDRSTPNQRKWLLKVAAAHNVPLPA